MGRRPKGEDAFEQTSLRLPSRLLERADALAPQLEQLPDHAHERQNRASVLRLALALGLRELERKVKSATG